MLSTAAIVLTMFVLVGIIDLLIIKESYIKTESNSVKIATRIEEDTTYYYLVYSYEVDSERYTCKGQEQLTKPIPKNEKIFYNEKEPKDCSIGYKKYENSVAVIIISSIIYLGCGIVIYKNMKKLSKKKKGKKNGK